MSAMLVGRTLHLPLDPSSKLVLISFADHANDDGAGIWASIQQTQIRTSLTRRSVQRALKHLELHGIIVAAGWRHGGYGKTTHWTINVRLVETVADAVIGEWRAWRDGERTEPWQHPFERVSESHPTDPTTVSESHPKSDLGCHCDLKGCHWPRPTVSESHPNHQEPSRTEEEFSISRKHPRRPGEPIGDYVARIALLTSQNPTIEPEPIH